MDLKTFVAQTIKDIFDGVIEAQEYAKDKGGKVNVYEHDCIRKINFDVAVTISGGKELGGGVKGKIIVAEANVGGKIAKGYSEVSRISFIIPVELPNKAFIRKGGGGVVK